MQTTPMTVGEIKEVITELQDIIENEKGHLHSDTIFRLIETLPMDEIAFLENDLYEKVFEDKPYEDRLKSIMLECIEFGNEEEIVAVLSEIFSKLSSTKYLWKILYVLFRELNLRGSKWEWDEFFDEFGVKRTKE